jgi:cardiolipin synthase A/B
MRNLRELLQVKLFIQPDDGVAPILQAVQRARKSISIMIFRFDRSDLEKALLSAVSRGVAVQALIAYTNRGGEKHLRELEMRLLAAGVTVARTSDDLVRYHSKMMVVDHSELFVLAFNFTGIDIDRSRSFGIATRNTALVREAQKLFDADCHRQPYTAGRSDLIVSPVNARRELETFLRKAKKELLIYDPHIGDPAMIRLLDEQAKAGVNIRVIGQLTRKSARIESRKLATMRLHTRAICRDGQSAFLGSQSLRTAELDSRREVGIILPSSQVVRAIVNTFEHDWAASEKKAEDAKEQAPTEKVAKKVAKVVSNSLPPIAPALEIAVKQVAGDEMAMGLSAEEIEETVKSAVVKAVKEVVRDVVNDAVEEAEFETEGAMRG